MTTTQPESSEPFHIPWSLGCEAANEHIEQLEAEARKLRWMLDACARDVEEICEEANGLVGQEWTKADQLADLAARLR